MSDNPNKKLSPKTTRIVSNLEDLNFDGLDFEFKMPSPAKKDEGIQVVRPTKKNSRVKELF